MKCSIQGCSGHYESTLIVHTLKRHGEVVVFENVPAEICDVCSDILLSPDTIRHLETLLSGTSQPERVAAVYAYK